MQDKINLLIIEDDPVQTFLIKESIDPNLYNISDINDGSEALEYLLNVTSMPDLVLMDYHLPNMDGLMIMNKLKEHGKKYNIVFLTADYSIETAIKSINAGALEFIPKDNRFVNNIPAIISKACQTIKTKHELEDYEQALKESETRFKMVIEASKDGIFEWIRSKGYVHVSANLANLLGYTIEEYPKSHKNFFDLVHPDDRELLQSKLIEHLNNHTSLYEAEVRLKTKNGNYKWILERGIVAEKDEQSEPVRVFGTHSDITERKNTEEKIVEANRQLTTLIGNLPGIVYRCRNSNFFEKELIGGRIEEITGFQNNEITPESLFSFANLVLTGDKENIELTIAQIAENKQEYEFYYRIKSKSGELKWIWDHGKLVKSNDNEHNTLEGYITDITEKRLSEEALKKSEEEKNIILDNSLQAFILLNPDGKILSFNKIANHRTILTVGKTLKKGDSVFDYIHPLEIELVNTFFQRVILGEPTYWEQPFNLRGNVSWFENILVPVFASRDEIKYVCYTSTDITERKISQESIINSESLYNTTINSLNDILYVVDNKLRILLANTAFKRFTQQNNHPEPVAGNKLNDILSPFQLTVENLYDEVFQTGNEIIKEDTLSVNGKNIVIELKITPVVQNNDIIRAVTVIRDITERKNFEKRIMNAIIETEERERKRFSEDLHDEMGSILSTIKIYINTIHREDIENKQKVELVEFTNQLINQAIQNSKEIANNLSPNIIKKFGLISAIQSFCDKIQNSNSLSIQFLHTYYNFDLKEDEEICIYRIISELVNNSVKHAEATAINIDFNSRGEKINIQYSDNGKGFNFEQTLQESKKGLGLQNIISRISSLNGTYSAQTALGGGFLIDIELII
jgi:PAS domain S-box-containing protein